MNDESNVKIRDSQHLCLTNYSLRYPRFLSPPTHGCGKNLAEMAKKRDGMCSKSVLIRTREKVVEFLDFIYIQHVV